MEELLRYSLLQIVIFILILEGIFLLLFAVAIFFIKFLSDQNFKRYGLINDVLTEHIVQALKEKSYPSFPRKYCRFKNIIHTLENFTNRFTDEELVKVRDFIIDNYLIETARKNVKSRSWIKRQLAARCFLLNPLKSNSEDLEILLDDPMFLVRVIAARVIIQGSNQKLFEAVIKKMAEETPLSRYTYRDSLINADSEKFHWLEELVKKETNPEVCSLCLDLLSTRTTKNHFSIAKNFIYSGSKKCKLNAIKILKSLPGKETVDMLTHSLSDSEWEIRSEGAKALASLRVIEASSKLQSLLSDDVWFVRLQAALALKQFDQEGMKLLSAQKHEESPHAYEIAQYVLSLP